VPEGPPGRAAGPVAGPAIGAAAPEWGEEGLREGSSFGTWLRRQREMREIDLREIADKTKISLRYLKAMEQDRFELLPAPVFARGFLREYSKYVGLNADEVVNYYLSTQHGHTLEEEANEELVDPGRSRGPVTRGAFLALLLIVAAALLAYFLFYRQSQEDARRAAPPPIAPPATETVPTEVPPPQEEVLSAPLVVTLDFIQECWVDARVDGAPQVSRLFVAGESIQLEGEETVELSLGNGGGVEAQVNNMPLGLDADPGDVVSVTIDLATVERLRQRGG
jgi:transcriptional regulator with XRE-family HTH domain